MIIRSVTLCLVFLLSVMLPCVQAEDEVAEVRRGNLQITLSREGHFIPANPSLLEFSPEAYQGALRIDDIVENATRVHQGEAVLRFEREPIDDVLQMKKLDLKAAELQLANARSAFAMLEADMELAHASAQSKLKWAKRKLAEFTEIELPLSDEEYVLNRQRRVDSIDEQKEEIAQLGQMYSEDELTEETEEIVLRRSKRSLERSIASLALSDRRRILTLESQRPQQLEEMRLDLRAKEKDFTKLETDQKNQVALKEIEIRKSEIGVDKQARELERLQRDLELFTLSAPKDGIVFHGEADAKEFKLLKEKESPKPNTTLLTIVTPGEVKAQCSIDEKDLFRLPPNTTAIVKPVALPGTELPGILEPMELLPHSGDQWRAVIQLGETDERLLPRMKCSVEILVEELENVLLVPKMAVVDEEGKRYCYVKVGNDYEAHAVEVGKSNGTSTVIKSGVSEGDMVLIFTEPPEEKEEKEAQE